MTPQHTYSTHALPCPRTSTVPPPDFSTYAEKYAALRLEALLTSPTAFASSHAIESKFTPGEWSARIWRDDAVVLVCVAHPESEPPNGGPAEASLLAGEWVGSVILRGPMPKSEYALPPESGAPAVGADDAETKWQMTALFASSRHRRRGIAKMLIQAGKDYAVEETAKELRPMNVRLRAGIHPDNLLVLSLYSATGFVDAGRATGQEAYRTNGDSSSWHLKFESLSDEMKVYWTTARVAVCMEWVGESRQG
ncbi:hypothetical protein C8R43DRAFT_1061111 [Mycena crocata]|nr:hypothetical protein C8R43DRAFT_1061111 [Mycena crocata]